MNASRGVQLLMGGFAEGMRVIYEMREQAQRKEMADANHYYSQWAQAYNAYQEMLRTHNALVDKYNAMAKKYDEANARAAQTYKAATARDET